MMKFKIHKKEDKLIAELIGSKQLINDLDDGVDLVGNAEFNGAQSVIVHKYQLHPDFFELKTGLAGDILQKFSNYRKKLAIVGDFANISSKSLRDFIYESNKYGQVNFVGTLDEAILALS